MSFLFTDIEGSTALWDANPEGMRSALARHDELVRGAIESRGGHVFATGGDGYAVAFSTARDALESGTEAQRLLGAETWPDATEIRVRMGIHTGEADERDGDYFGSAVNLAARIMGAANGGQLVASAVTAGLLELHDLTTLIDLGEVTLKGLAEPVHVFGVASEGLDWVDSPLTSVQLGAGNLPRVQTEFVGSLAALQQRAAVLPQTSLVTLTGAGGVGKTRAAIEVGWLTVDEFRDGVWLAELGSVADRDSVMSVIASMLGVRGLAGTPMVGSIVDWCLHRRMLLILDNCEHVLDPVIELVSALMASCPTVSVMATSREPLGVSGEQVIRIPSLNADRSMELFINRAGAADDAFEPSPDDLVSIAAICDRLDGIPLAIELAAARTRSLSTSDLLDRLHDRFRLLRGGGRGGLERQQTLRATVTWSYQLLDPVEQLLFDRLSVFAGPFDLTSAEKICTDEELDEFDVVDLIGSLVDKSMLVADRNERGVRYRQLETLRQYGEERLDERDETAVLRDRHLAHYCALVVQLSDQWMSSTQHEAEMAMASLWDNLRAAHSWATISEDLDASVDLLYGVGPYATESLIHDHAVWSERTFALSEQLGVLSPMARAAHALWLMVDGDSRAAVAMVKPGANLDDPDPGAAMCVAGLLVAYGTQSLTAEVQEVERDARLLLERGVPAPIEMYVTQVLALLGTDRESDARALEAFGRRHEHPMTLMRGALSRGLACLNKSEPQTDEALAHFERARGFAWVPNTWASLLVECGSASALVLSNDNHAAESIHHALSLSHDRRNWMTVFQALDLAAHQLSGIDAEAAATIFGFAVQFPVTDAGSYALLRERMQANVHSIPDAERLMAIGASTDRHDIVQYALSRLAV